MTSGRLRSFIGSAKPPRMKILYNPRLSRLADSGKASYSRRLNTSHSFPHPTAAHTCNSQFETDGYSKNSCRPDQSGDIAACLVVHPADYERSESCSEGLRHGERSEQCWIMGLSESNADNQGRENRLNNIAGRHQ